jgi:PAS domain S-box-containing protein
MDNTTAQSPIRVEDFLRLTQDAVVVIDRRQHIVLFNDTAEQIFGYCAAEICGQPLDLLIPAAFKKIHRTYVRKFSTLTGSMRRMAERKEIAGRRKDGAEFPAEASIAKITRNGQDFFVVFLRDITLRKRMEEDLFKWAQAFENAEWGVVIGQANATRLETMNPAFARLYGYSLEEMTGKPIEDLYAPQDRPKVRAWIQKAHKEGHITYEATHLRKDGSVFPVSVDITAVKDPEGQVQYRVVNVRDITEQKKIETELRESESRYASIVSSMDEGIVLQDADGKIRTCNASAEKILGLSADQMMGLTSIDPRWNAVHEDGSPYPGETHPAYLTLHTGKPYSNVIIGVHKPDGSLTWTSVNTQPIFRPGESKPSGVVASFTDVTEQRRAYQLLEQRVEERTRHLSALLEVARNMSTILELKPLLTSILQQLRLVVDFTGAVIASLEGDEIVFLEYVGPFPRDKMLRFHPSTAQDNGYTRVIQARKPVIIGELWADDPWERSVVDQVDPELLPFFEQIHSWLGVPLISRDCLIGVLRLDHVEPNHFTEKHANLVMAFANQAALAIDNARLYEQAQAGAALEERQKLARELHDSVSQVLYSIGLGVRTARARLEHEPEKASEPLDYCISLAEAGLAEMRALIFELRPESLEVEGLVAALSKQADALQARHSIAVEKSFCEEPGVPLAIKESLYRISQEALNNIVKHARATQVDLGLKQIDGTLLLEVKDNGQGFDPGENFPGHLGLNSMRERVERVGGSFEVESRPSGGTRICVRVPIKE